MPRIVSTYKEEARKKILEAALETFKAKGYFRSTMEDVSDKLGISKGAIYRYFDSKDQLLAALYMSGPENLRSEFTSSSSGSISRAAKEVFKRMGTRANAKLFADFLAEASRNDDLARVLRDNIGRFEAVVEDLVKSKSPGGSVTDRPDLRQIASMLGLIFNGLACWLATGVDESEVKRIWANSVDILLGPYEDAARQSKKRT